jgi:SnoaL-like polyketide cyclase
MSQENVEVVRRANALTNAGDWDALAELCHPDIETRNLQSPLDMPEVVQGREDQRGVATGFLEVYDEFGAQVYEYIDAHPWVICDVRWHGKGKGSDVPIEMCQSTVVPRMPYRGCPPSEGRQDRSLNLRLPGCGNSSQSRGAGVDVTSDIVARAVPWAGFGPATRGV